MLTQKEQGKVLVSTNPFTAFIELIQLDQALRSCQNDITKTQVAIQEETVQQQELTHRFEQYKQQAKELRKAIDACELEIKDLDAQEKDKKNLLEHASNVKEFQPLKKEIDHLKQRQNDIEAHLMAAWNKFETAEKELKEQQTVFEEKSKALQESIVAKQDSITQLQNKLTQIEKDRPTKEAAVPNEWLEKYTHMRMQVADPVIEVLRGACGACFYTITDQELLRLKKRALIQCKGCFRLMYMPEVMKEESATTSEVENADATDN